MNAYGSGTSGPGGWQADPTGRHQLRFWNGVAWTDDVADNGVPGRDPLATQAPASAYGNPQATGGPYAPAGAYAAGGPYGAGNPYAPAGAYAAAPYGAYPAAAAGGRSPRRLVGGVVAVVGGGLVAGGSLLDWFGGGGFSLTGWDLYDLRSKMDENIFFINKFYDDSLPLFTGLTTLIVGCILAAVALLVIALPAGKPGGPEVAGGVKAVGWIALLLAAIPALVNVVGWFAKGQGQGVDAAAGFWLVIVGAVVGIVGMALGTAGRRPAQW